MSAEKTLPKLSTNDLALVFGLTARRVRQLVSEGVIPAPAGGQHDIATAIQAMLQHARTTKDAAPLAAARARVAEARARQIELQIAEADGRVVDLSEAMEIFDEMTGVYIKSLTGLPARCTRDMTLRRKIESECDNIRNELSRRFREAEAELKPSQQTKMDRKL